MHQQRLLAFDDLEALPGGPFGSFEVAGREGELGAAVGDLGEGRFDLRVGGWVA